MCPNLDIFGGHQKVRNPVWPLFGPKWGQDPDPVLEAVDAES